MRTRSNVMAIAIMLYVFLQPKVCKTMRKHAIVGLLCPNYDRRFASRQCCQLACRLFLDVILLHVQEECKSHNKPPPSSVHTCRETIYQCNTYVHISSRLVSIMPCFSFPEIK